MTTINATTHQDATVTITAQEITINGTAYPVIAWQYSEDTGVVTGTVGSEGHTLALTFGLDNARYAEALAAATQEQTTEAQEQPAEEQTTEAQEQPAEEQTTEAQEQPTEEQPAEPDPAKQAHGPVPEKTWIGEIIQGQGWRIDFDKVFGKTRVIFDRVPTKEAREAVKAAGFYWSQQTGSWNKGLNWRAYRAAQALAATLGSMRVLTPRR